MDAIIDEFEQRVDEVDSYLKLLVRIENLDVVLDNQAKVPPLRVLGEDSFKVMKATVFLLIYNLVESSIRSALRRVYEKIEDEGKTLGDVREELRSLWIGQRFRSYDSYSASAHNYRELVEQITEEVLQRSVLKLSAKRLPISGNLDSDRIRDICKRHGVEVTVHHDAKGGVELGTVKDQRNALGHGSVTFTECGRQYAVSDLDRIKRQTVVFVRSILESVERYLEEGAYAGEAAR